MMHRPSLTAFAADVTRFAGTLLAAAVIVDYRAHIAAAEAENEPLRCDRLALHDENEALRGENEALARIADDMARKAATAQRMCDQLATAAREDAEIRGEAS